MEKRKTKIITTIQGHKVVLIFADKPNPCVAEHIKEILLGNYTQQQKTA